MVTVPSGIARLMLGSGEIVLTWPLCGWLFLCGCTWLWKGGAEHCNYYDRTVQVHCPWCEHPWMSGTGILLGVALSLAVYSSLARQAAVAGAVAGWSTLRFSCWAVLGFLVWMTVFGAITAWLTGYPQFVLSRLMP